MLNYEVLEIMLFALLGGVEPPLMHMVRFENLKTMFFLGILTNTSSLKNVHAINVML